MACTRKTAYFLFAHTSHDPAHYLVTSQKVSLRVHYSEAASANMADSKCADGMDHKGCDHKLALHQGEMCSH